jgi:8-oxo-dGTP pyrophosphatase MutT (NUDIX family)
MHRTNLLNLLDGYRTEDAADAERSRRLRSFVESHERCFDRGLEVGHVTGAAWIVGRSRDRALLTHHRKLDRWLQLGGHCDGDSDILRVALREAREESGLHSLSVLDAAIFDLDVHSIPARGGEAAHRHYDVRFLLEADETEPLVVSHESKELRWVELARLAECVPDESVVRMGRKFSRWKSPS